MLEIKEDTETHIKSFKVRNNDRCTEEDCNGTLIIEGVRDKEEDMYAVITFCEVCGKFYNFMRVDKDKIEGRVDFMDRRS